MKFYTKTHKYYCGIDLHTKQQYLCILNNAGEIVLHQNIPTKPQVFLKTIAPYREDLIVGVECMFSWYWLADLCAQEKIAFILGHALYMKAIHGGKAKSDKIDSEKIDSEKIARLIKGGTFPLAYTYRTRIGCVRNEPQPNPVVEPVRWFNGILYKGNSDFGVERLQDVAEPRAFVQASLGLTGCSDF